MGRRLTHEEFVERLNKINNKITPLEKYQTGTTKILVRCDICNHEWKVVPCSLLRGTGCPVCADRTRNDSNRKTHEQFINEMSVVNPNIEILEKYTRSNVKVHVRCSVCNHEWEARPDKLLIGRGCPICAREKIRRERVWTQERFVNELSKVNPNIIVLGQYYNARTKVLVKCKVCGHEWETTPDPLLHKGIGCPSCIFSKGEFKIKTYLDKNNIVNTPFKSFEGCVHIYTLKFDFYLPDYNLCIEYDGKQHFEPVEWFGGEEGFIKSTKRDRIKDEFCKDNGIDLLRIPYTEFDNVEEILKNKLHIQ